ncbi:hypothetical protein [Paraburkholderia caribensis]|uniref:hypothetical protein n=1 Tax=Paraburkholderia caribensis TaxID=75105 RepID=UPI0034D2B2AE
MKKHVAFLKYAALGLLVLAFVGGAVALAVSMELAKFNDCRGAGRSSFACIARSIL